MVQDAVNSGGCRSLNSYNDSPIGSANRMSFRLALRQFHYASWKSTEMRDEITRKVAKLRTRIRAEHESRYQKEKQLFPHDKKDEVGAKLFLVEQPFIAGRKPKRALPVDNFVSRLCEAKKLRLDVDFHLAQQGINCSYLITRLYVYRAFKDAEFEEKYTPLHRGDLQAAAKLCELAEGALEEIVLQRSEALESIHLKTSITTSLLQQRVRDTPSAKGEVWRIRFARTLGYAWLDLTGRNPAWAEGQGFLFVNFVEAAHETVSSAFQGTWARQCRTAIQRENRLPAGERWDFRRLIREHPLVKFRSSISTDAEASLT
jgi:hypothetical protein